MGVYGLWRLLDATGKQVPLETLEGKVLAIDISIWIHQVLQGYQDRFGNPKPNAHLIGLFHRICKLLYYKIKPIFVFDGGVPMLKKETIALRRKQKSMAKNKAQQMRTELINNLIKHSAVKTVLNTEKENVTNNPSEMVLNLPNKQTVDDIFKLPDMPSTSKTEVNLSDDYDSDSSVEPSPRKQTKWIGNIHSVDVTSAEFKTLPADVRYEILTDLKETRKQSSWGRLHEMPEESNDFASFQMKRLLKRRLVQQSLESAEKEMGGKTLTLDELDKLLTEQGISTNGQNCTYRIAADSTTRLIYISDKNAYIKNSSSNVTSDDESSENNINKTDEPVASSSKSIAICDDINEYELDDEWVSDIDITSESNFSLAMETDSDVESEVELNESRPLPKKYFKKNVTNPALTYMLEYSGLTEKQIVALLEQSKKENHKDPSKILKASQQTVSFKTQNCEKEDNLLNIPHLTSVPENNREYAKLDSPEVVKSNHTQSTELSESNAEMDTNFPTSTSNVSNKTEVKPTEATVVSSSDSDMDDFIEIEDKSVEDESNMNISIDKNVSQKGIQITFRSDEKVEDDMFADVFKASNSELNAKINSQNMSSFIEVSEKSVKNFNSDQESVEDKIILDETRVQSMENHLKDKQLSDIRTVNDVQVQSVRNNTDCSNANTLLKKDQMKETTNMEDAINSVSNSNSNMQDSADKNILIDDTGNVSPIPVNEEELLSLKARLEDEQTELMANIGKLERQGIDISDRIRAEAQELLRFFGIPYVVAPLEAEAQCAYLEQIHLTDGTITDDSDIWLFGGQCVYKNFFDNNKKVLQFCSCDIQHHFKLTRNEMIRLALLVGSDYTAGLSGIGPVTALEILAAFPSESDDLLQGLMNFCSWIESGRIAAPGKTSLRNKLQNLKIHKGFPSQAVVQAYLFPKVDESKEGFTWGKPNMILLYEYTKQKFGWDKNKFNKIMSPVLKRFEERKTQKLIDTYFKLQTVPQSIEMSLSKRVQKAVQKLNSANVENTETVESTQEKSSTKKLKSLNENRKKKKQVKNEQDVTDSTKCTNKNRKKKKVIKGEEGVTGSSTPMNENQKKKEDAKSEQGVSGSTKPKVFSVATRDDKSFEEYIPQREKDKANSLKKKLHAIEVLRKSKQGLCKTKKIKRCVRKVKAEAELSESDSS